MVSRSIDDSQRRWLMSEMTDWQAEDLISAEQCRRILGRYETDEEVDRRKQSRIVFALLGMAAFLFALAVLMRRHGSGGVNSRRAGSVSDRRPVRVTPSGR